MSDLCTKRRYDKKGALSAANFRKRNGEGRCRRGKQKNLRAYHCDQCQAWHLTHKRKIHRHGRGRRSLS